MISLYARGLTVREMQEPLQELYSTEVSPTLISAITDAVLGEVTAWQQRPLAPLYPVVFFDALRVKIRDETVVRNQAVYLALGVLRDGTKEVLGLWIEQTEGAKFWLRVMNELKTRGVTSSLPSSMASPAFRTRSPRSFRRPPCRPASCICCGTRWTS